MRFFTLVLLACLVLPVSSLQAQEKRDCVMVRDFAEAAMGARQAGVPRSNIDVKGDGQDMLARIVKEAFETPRTPEGNMSKIMGDFGKKWYQACLSA